MANEVRLIDMNVAMFNAHKEIYWTESQATAVCNFLVHQPTVDPETLRPKGRWIERKSIHAEGGISAKCSVCNKSVQYLGNPLNYCPHCGADMRGESE